ncbi:hypothetical protein ACFLX8_02895 [Chloroflexota bacterium]
MNNEHIDEGTRQERREKRLKKKRERIAQHGRSLAQIYKEAILKRLKLRKFDKEQKK